jgi:hypothetical protein
MVRASDGLGNDLRDIKDIQLVAEQSLVVILWHAVGGHELVDAAVLDPVLGIAAEHAVGDEGVDVDCTLLLEQLGCPNDLDTVSIRE